MDGRIEQNQKMETDPPKRRRYLASLCRCLMYYSDSSIYRTSAFYGTLLQFAQILNNRKIHFKIIILFSSCWDRKFTLKHLDRPEH